MNNLANDTLAQKLTKDWWKKKNKNKLLPREAEILIEIHEQIGMMPWNKLNREEQILEEEGGSLLKYRVEKI